VNERVATPWFPNRAAAGAALLLREPDRRWDLLLICLAGYVLTGVGRVHQVFAVLEPLRLTMVSSALAIALYLVDRSRGRRLQPVLRVGIVRWIVGLGVWMGLSVPGALWAGGAFETFVEFTKMVVVCVILVGAVRGVRDVERLAFVYLLSVAIYAAAVITRFQVGPGDWRLGSLYYYDANEFAALAVISLPLGVYFIARPHPSWRRLASVPAVAALTVAIIWAGSRGGFLALLAVGAFLLVRYTAIHLRWRILTAALLGVVFAATASDTYWEKMKTITKPKDDYNVTGEEGRLKVWKRGIGYMLEHPLLGVGAGNFSTAEGTLSPVARAATVGRGVKWSVAHNSFVQIGAELGVPGLILFAGALLGAFRALGVVRQRARRVRPPGDGGPTSPNAPLAQALSASLIGYVVGGFFLSLAHRDLLLVLLALVAALRKVTPLAVPPATPSPRLVTWWS